MQTWTDVRLKWDPSHFGNIKQFYTNSSLIWTPEIGWVTMWVLQDFSISGGASMMMPSVWDIVYCSVIEVYKFFRGKIALMKGVSTSETSGNFHETTRRRIPESCHLRVGFVS
jgi:hypothetical protein